MINSIISHITLKFGFEWLETAVFSENINCRCSVAFSMRCTFLAISKPNGTAHVEQPSWKWLSLPKMLLKPAGASSCIPLEQPVPSAIPAQTIASDCSSPRVVITISTWVFSSVSFEIFLQLIFLWKKVCLLTISCVSCLLAKHLQQHIISASLMWKIQELHAHADLCYTVWNYIGNAWILCVLLSFALFSHANITTQGNFLSVSYQKVHSTAWNISYFSYRIPSQLFSDTAFLYVGAVF